VKSVVNDWIARDHHLEIHARAVGVACEADLVASDRADERRLGNAGRLIEPGSALMVPVCSDASALPTGGP
jgi:hypothetical protein